MERGFFPPQKRPSLECSVENVKMFRLEYNGKVLFQVEFGFPLVKSYLFVPFMGI